jgi:hypothetical protein
MEGQGTMPDSKPAEQSAASKPAQPEAKPAEAKPQARQGDNDPGKGTGDAVKAQHVARTTVPGRDGVDARLDNRSNSELDPPPYDGVNKPQHVDGPDVAGQVEHTRSVLAARAKKA